MWSPIYGKLSAVSEVELNFQFYALGGVGIDGLWKVQSVNTGTEIRKEMEFAPTFVVPSAHFGARRNERRARQTSARTPSLF